MEAPKQMRRNSAANRAINAVTSQAQLQLTPSPSPLLTQAPSNTQQPALVKPIKRIDPRIFEEDQPMPEDAVTSISGLQERLKSLEPVPAPVNSLRDISDDLLSTIAEYVALDDVRLCTVLSRVCRRFYSASLHLVSNVTLCPDVVSIDALSRPGAFTSLCAFFSAAGRGQHVRTLSLVRGDSVYSLPNTVRGPEVHAQDLARLITQLPRLQSLDIRGIAHRSFSAWCDHLLTDAAAACPELKSIRVGVVYLSTWENGWWTSLQSLEEFVVGSRREDAAWLTATPSAQPVAMPDDMLAMMRSAPSLQRVKVWTPLNQASFAALLQQPSAPFPTLQHLAVNVAGHTDWRPLEDAQKEAEAAKEAAPAKGGAKASKGGAKAQEAAEGPKPMYPALTSFTICDVKDRPELVPELMVKMQQVAPSVEHWNVTNTHRNAPGKVQPVTNVRGRAKAQS